jgi:HlyD family type I secretion membrane fusion protein
MAITTALIPQKPEIQTWYHDVPRNPRLAIMSGVVIIGLTVGGFGFWANSAQIAGAVVATGVFVTAGQNKTVQHLEGGIIKDILVDEGNKVTKGQLLVKLDDNTAKAELRRLILRQARLVAIEARLRAEVTEQANIEFPPNLVMLSSDPEVAQILRTQQATFDARQRNMQSDISALMKSIDGLREKIKGGKIQMESVFEQTKYVKEELAGKQTLFDQGFARKPELLALKRTQAGYSGEIGRLNGDMGDAQQRIGLAEEQIRGIRKTAIRAAVEQMQENSAELNDLGERIRTATTTLERTKISAPVNGTVVKLRYHTSTGVIGPGQSIMEIVPLGDDLIIEARVRPQDIDKIRDSHEAVVRLTALNQRTTPMVNGKVIYVSADALPDEKTRNDLYIVRVSLERADLNKIIGFEPKSGMPAEVYIQTAPRTFFEYLMQPLKDSLSRAFRES